MKIKGVKAEKIYDSRKEATISVFVKTEKGLFSASSPSGNSIGKYEANPYINDLDGDIKLVDISSKKIKKLKLSNFKDLIKVEKEIKLGANSLFALEAALLKALAEETHESVWELINPNARKFPIPVGNCIGGGLHTRHVRGKKPDFQEFLILPRGRKFSEKVFLMNKFHKLCGERLKLRKACGKLNDEGAWSTSLGNEEVLEVMKESKEELQLQVNNKIGLGLDAAASSFYSGFIYHYENPRKKLGNIQQINYISELVNDFSIEYVEDPLQEEAFSDFKLLRESVIRSRPCLIVGDDLTTTNLSRFKKALKNESINAIIIKPNQIGSLIEVKKIIDICDRVGVATIMSHRSGETMDTCIADLGFGFQTDFIKTGIKGKEREVKLNRLINIEKSLN